MTAKAALCKLLLEGRVLNIKNCFSLIGITNAPREVSRSIEKPFGVIISRTHRIGKSRYGQSRTWTDYRLNSTPMNQEGIVKMREYLKSQGGELPEEKPVIQVSAHTRNSKKELLKQDPLF